MPATPLRRRERHTSLRAALLVTSIWLLPTTSRAWTGPDGEPLPFADATQAIEFLVHAEVVETKVLSTGSTRPTKLTLERDGVRAHAIFRTVDASQGSGRREFRDNFSFEVAAFEVARLLGLDAVPPTTLRRIGSDDGSIQLWIENARSETRRIEENAQVENQHLITLQKLRMKVFDALIHNFDRNTGNMLIDAEQRLWLVDHTRAFKNEPKPPEELQNLAVCERAMWQRMSALDAQTLRRRLAPHLDALALSALVERHAWLVDWFARKIADQGEAAVLFDLPAGP